MPVNRLVVCNMQHDAIVFPNIAAFLAAMRAIHGTYVWIAPVPIILVVISSSLSIRNALAVFIIGYVLIFVLFVGVSALAVKIRLLRSEAARREYGTCTNEERARVVASALLGW